METVLTFRYTEAFSAWPEQVFENTSTRVEIGREGNLKLYSNTARVHLTLVKHSDAIMQIDSHNGHQFGFFDEVCTDGMLPATLLSPRCFFTFRGGVLTFHENSSDQSGKYEYKLVHTPVCSCVRDTENKDFVVEPGY